MPMKRDKKTKRDEKQEKKRTDAVRASIKGSQVEKEFLPLSPSYTSPGPSYVILHRY